MEVVVGGENAAYDDSQPKLKRKKETKNTARDGSRSIEKKRMKWVKGVVGPMTRERRQEMKHVRRGFLLAKIESE
jgi:hypothetical protein